jgi:hypothetical protein
MRIILSFYFKEVILNPTLLFQGPFKIARSLSGCRPQLKALDKGSESSLKLHSLAFSIIDEKVFEFLLMQFLCHVTSIHISDYDRGNHYFNHKKMVEIRICTFFSSSGELGSGLQPNYWLAWVCWSRIGHTISTHCPFFHSVFLEIRS